MKIIELDKEEFNETIKEGYYLIDYYANWCGPCQMLKPVLEEYSLIQNEINIIKIDIDKFPLMAEENNIMGVPTLILYKNGKENNRTSGYKNIDQLSKWIDQNK